MKSIESIIILPSKEMFVNPALAFIRSLAAACGFSGSTLNDIEMAAEEAVTNVIKHAFEGKSDETFKLSVYFTEADFIITIYEKGMPFSPQNIPGYDPGKLENSLKTDGLGVFLMKKVMDDVIFENLGRDGKSITLVKHLNAGNIKQILEDYENKILVKDRPDTSGKNILYDIRLFKPEDALEISRCAYKSYGYTYEPYIYYPEKIVEMNQTGNLLSVIAAGKDTGEIMGHMAFKYKNPADRIAEFGVAFVKPEYRKSGILKSMTNFCHEKAIELKLLGIFARAVTSHVGSQKVLDSMIYTACGVFLGLFPDDVDFKALTGKIRQKETGLLFYRKVLEEKEIRKIYVPSRYQKKISDLFESFKIKVKFGENQAEPAGVQSKINVNIVPALNIAEVEVDYIGSDIMHELKLTVHNLCLKHIDAIFLHIDMEDPNASFVAAECEKSGFFFSGVLPFGMNNKHEFILQYMNNLAINYDIIKPYSQSATDILNFIRTFDMNTQN